MSLVLTFLRWLFGRRLSATERDRVWAIDTCGWLLEQLEADWFSWESPSHRAWLLRHVRGVERAAFRWAPKNCGPLAELMLHGAELETLIQRICAVLQILLGVNTGPLLGKAWKRRRGRKFLHRKKFVAWLRKRRAFVKAPLHPAARGPPIS